MLFLKIFLIFFQKICIFALIISLWKVIVSAQNAYVSSSPYWNGIRKQILACFEYHFASLRTSIPLVHVMILEGLRLTKCSALHSLLVLSHQPSSFSA